ncbi:hypothetical protein EP7_002518 [Isosphaeraceae bacterium EP7]
MAEVPPQPVVAPPSRMPLLMLGLINLALLAALLVTSGRVKLPSVMPGVGASLVVLNETLAPMLEMTLTYPGGNFPIPRLDAGKSVGSPVNVPGECKATLSFRDEDGNPYTQEFTIKPVGDFLILIYVLPVLEPSEVELAGGSRQKVLVPSRTKARVLVSYQGENLNI